MSHRPLLPAALIATAILGGCGGTGYGAGAGAKTISAAESQSAAKRLAKAPAALRANAADANTIAGTGTAALDARLAKLKGHPVVVNQWASWCGPCRAEFPLFADAVAVHGDKVAFVGIDYNDNRDDAAKFLDELPPGFASIYDRGGDAVRSLGGRSIAPTTFFIGSDGKRRYIKFGGYADAATLEADIRRYAQ